MSVRTYGIYLAYPPKVDLRIEGLGRHLAELLKAAQDSPDFTFVVLCPSWTRKSLTELLEANAVDPQKLEIISPEKEPLLLNLYDLWRKYRSRRSKKRLLRFILALRKKVRALGRRTTMTAVSTRNPIFMGVAAIGFVGALLALSPIFLVFQVARRASTYARRIVSRLLAPIFRVLHFPLLGSTPHHVMFVQRMYRLMEDAETDLLTQLAHSRNDVRAWFSPTAFWPGFHAIKRPRLMCVPDAVLTRFPVEFSKGDARTFTAFKHIEMSIRGASHMVTYSEDVRTRTLVDHFYCDASKIDVVRHGANTIDHFISVKGTPNDQEATQAFCQSVFRSALRKAIGAHGNPGSGSGVFPFIFYASQFRPSKNILNLLRAYNFLLKRRFLNVKLVLTGRPDVHPEISQFLDEHNLRNDVLCLHGLTNQEWAACYKLATIAVNPSLAEGGCPFTFSEALSVDTPVVMARIAVTEEVITDPLVQKSTFFDPYDMFDIAKRIEWAIDNRDELYRIQRKFYDEVISQRTWQHVVNDYVSILDRISQPENSSEEKLRANMTVSELS